MHCHKMRLNTILARMMSKLKVTDKRDLQEANSAKKILFHPCLNTLVLGIFIVNRLTLSCQLEHMHLLASLPI